MLSKSRYVKTRVKVVQTPVEGGVPDIGEPDKYELFLRRADVLEILLTLQTDVGGKKMNGADVLHISPDELLYTGEYLGGAQHGLNRVFAASQGAETRLPFYARARGKELQIGRISDSFTPKSYSVEGYEKPTRGGQKERVEGWLEELSDVGISFELPEGEKWKALTNEEAHKLVEKISDELKTDTNTRLDIAQAVYQEEMAEKERAKVEIETAEREAVERAKTEKVESTEESKARIERMATAEK